MPDILEQIDATVDGRCACGCGTVLSPRGRSGWWASEACQERWQHRQVGAAPADVEEQLIAHFEAMYCRPRMTTTDGPVQEPPHRWRQRVDLVLADRGQPPEVVTGEPGRGRPRVPVNAMVLAEIVVPPSSRIARATLAGGQWLRHWTWLVLHRLYPLAFCPGHGRRGCFMCDWPGPDVVESLAAAHRGGPVRRRLRINLRVDASGYEEGMARAVAATRAVGADYARLETEDGQRFESHVCQWELPRFRSPSNWRQHPHLTEWYGCTLRWSDGTRCDSTTVDPSDVRRTERLVGPRATGDADRRS